MKPHTGIYRLLWKYYSRMSVFFSSGLERDKFDNKTVTFEEHIKVEHNMWHYLFFIVLVKVKDSTEYTGPESYVAEMIRVRTVHCISWQSRQISVTSLCYIFFQAFFPMPHPFTNSSLSSTHISPMCSICGTSSLYIPDNGRNYLISIYSALDYVHWS